MDIEPAIHEENMYTRAPKHLGDFGEGLVTYTLIRKGFEVACVDHVGADLIAERQQERQHHKLAVSVKTRRYKAGSIESRGTVIEFDHLQKLEHFAKRFDLDPVFAHVVSIVDDKIIHLFMIRTEDIKNSITPGKYGYPLNYSKKQLPLTIALSYIDYSSWSNESIGSKLFGSVS